MCRIWKPGRDERYTTAPVLPVAGATQVNPNGTITGLRNADGNPFGTRRDLAIVCNDPNTPPSLQCPINANFGNPSQYQPPRVFRFGLRATF